MRNFIYDHTKERTIRISHIASVYVVEGSLNTNPSLRGYVRYYNVECETKNKQKFTLASEFETKQSALNWMKGLGFLK